MVSPDPGKHNKNSVDARIKMSSTFFKLIFRLCLPSVSDWNLHDTSENSEKHRALNFFFISSHIHERLSLQLDSHCLLEYSMPLQLFEGAWTLLVSAGNLHHMVIVLAFEGRNGSQIGLNLIRSQACTDNPINLSWLSKKGLANDTRGGGKPTTLTDVQITCIQWDAGEQINGRIAPAGRWTMCADTFRKEVEVWGRNRHCRCIFLFLSPRWANKIELDIWGAF